MGVKIEDKIKEIQKILVLDERVPITTAKKINDNLKVILLLANKKEK